MEFSLVLSAAYSKEHLPAAPEGHSRVPRRMDYAYLNQAAAAGFEASSCSLGGSLGGSMDGAHAPYTYGDLTSCSQMPSAYRYTGSGVRGYNAGVGVGVGSQQCGVMGRPQDHRAMFPASVTPVNLQSKSRLSSRHKAQSQGRLLMPLATRPVSRPRHVPPPATGLLSRPPVTCSPVIIAG